MTEKEKRGPEIRRVLIITLALNVVVALAKLIHGVETETMSVKADGFHSAVDAVNNLVGLIAVWWSLRPPDKEHPYGHQKVEVLAASVVGASLILMSYNLIVGAVERLYGAGLPPKPTTSTLILLAGTLLVNVFVAQYEAHQAKRLKSTFLESDASHTRSDILVTIGVFITVVAVRSGYTWMDAGFAFLIAMFILLTGVQLVKRNLNYLIDTAQIGELEVEEIVCKVPGVASVHKIRTRGTPATMRMDLHIQIARHLNVYQAHEVTHWVIEALKAGIENLQDVVVHTEPALKGASYPELPHSLMEQE